MFDHEKDLLERLIEAMTTNTQALADLQAAVTANTEAVANAAANAPADISAGVEAATAQVNQNTTTLGGTPPAAPAAPAPAAPAAVPEGSPTPPA